MGRPDARPRHSQRRGLPMHRSHARRPRSGTITRRSLFTYAAAAGLVLAGEAILAKDGLAASSTDTGTLIVGVNFVIKSLDPARAFETTSSTILHATYDTLVTFNGEDLKTPRPSLATSWKTSADGLTVTFALRPNVKFASGNSLTSADVKWSFD